MKKVKRGTRPTRPGPDALRAADTTIGRQEPGRQPGAFALWGQRIPLDLLLIPLLLVGTYAFIGSSYEFASADAGTYALKTRLLVQERTLDLGGQAALSLGQLLVGSVFAKILGFSLWSLSVAVYVTVGACFVLFYKLLVRTGLDHRLALIGSLTLFVNPIGLRFVDWYLTEPFFFLFVLAALNAYAAGFERESAGYVLAGGALATVAVFTRQYGVFLPLAVAAVWITHRRYLKRLALPILSSALLPLLALGAFYLFTTVEGDYAMQANHLQSMTNPRQLLQTLLDDGMVTLDYLTIYAFPIYLLILVAAVAQRRLRALLFETPYATAAAFGIIVAWTGFRYTSSGALMPYRPSVFGLYNLTSVWGFELADPWVVSVGLSVVCVIGATLFVSRVVASEPWSLFGRLDAQPPAAQLTRELLWWCGILSLLVTSGAGMFYDRHIFHIAIFAIAFLLSTFPWVAPFRKTGLLILLAVYAVFIFDIKRYRLAEEAQWSAAANLMAAGATPLEINAGLGFNYYNSFHQIETIYDGFGSVNFHKFHPMANYFVFQDEAEGRLEGLDLLRVETDESRWPLFRPSAYVFRRTQGFDGPILPNAWRHNWERQGMIGGFTQTTRNRMRQLASASDETAGR